MTHLYKQTLMLTGSLRYRSGITQEQMKKEFDWPHNISDYGITAYLVDGIRKGWIREAVKLDGTLVYYTTAKGRKEYERYHS